MLNDTNKEDITEGPDAPDTASDDQITATISINDLANIKHMIDVASSRGAFKAGEFQVVGATYDRLAAFLASVSPPEATESTESTESTKASTEA